MEHLQLRVRAAMLAEAIYCFQDPRCPIQEANLLFVDWILPVVEDVAPSLLRRLGSTRYIQQLIEDSAGYIWLVLYRARQRGVMRFKVTKVTDPALIEFSFKKWITRVLINYFRRKLKRPVRPLPKEHLPSETAFPSCKIDWSGIEELVACLKELIHTWPERNGQKKRVNYLAVLLLYGLLRVWELAGSDELGGYIGELVQEDLLAISPEIAAMRILDGMPSLGELLNAVRNYVKHVNNGPIEAKEILAYLSRALCNGQLCGERWRQWLHRARVQFDEYTKTWQTDDCAVERWRILSELFSE
ncbi:MAG: hypothetical protein RMJ82_01385 [Gemmatales bacterium]|nr:hypothetical protein [Gemmatales bacterium]